jgi:enterochelin esterase family protein
MRRFTFALAVLTLSIAFKASAQSFDPEVHPDRTVTFRLKMPNAEHVQLDMETLDKPLDMAKGADGEWTVTTAALDPEYYAYSFKVDGESIADPDNPLRNANMLWPSSLFLVPGDTPQPWEAQDVPHGTIHHHFYKSAAISATHDYYVYTPPDYEKGRSYPVLYLLHGFGQDPNAWMSVGMVNTMLDNLIAAGKVKPMVVVMPSGYGIPDFVTPAGFPANDPARIERGFKNFRDALLHEIIPAVEIEYKVSSDGGSRAIAGLSMGGAQSLRIGLDDSARFAYLGAFSMGGIVTEFDNAFPGLEPDDVNRDLKMLYIACGYDDPANADNRKLKTWLKGKGVHFNDIETPGAHDWPVWRRNFVEFSQLIFK